MSHDGLTGGQKWRAATALWFVLIVVSLEQTAVNVALPAMAADFGASPAETTWVIKASLMGVLLTLLPFSALGENVGNRRVYQIGLGLYCLATVASILSPTLELLILARLLQGIGLSAISSVHGALTRYVFPSDRLAGALATSAFIGAVFGALGPPYGSTLIAIGSWHLVFALSLPLCVVSFALGFRSLPENPPQGRFNFTDALLYILTITAAFGGVEMLTMGISAIWPITAFAAGFAAGFLLIRRSARSQRPLVPLDLLGSRTFRLSVLTSIGAFCAQTIAFIALPFHLTGAMQRPLIAVGPLMMCWPLAITIAAPLAARLSRRVPAAIMAGVGMALMGVGLAASAMLTNDATPFDIVWRFVISGFGFGLFQTPNNHLVLTSAPMDRAGAAAGMQALARQIGRLGGASLAAIFFILFPHDQIAAIYCAAAIAGFAAGASLWRMRG